MEQEENEMKCQKSICMLFKLLFMLTLVSPLRKKENIKRNVDSRDYFHVCTWNNRDFFCTK